MMNFNHLYYFYVIAKMNGVSAAARHLRTSQSSLSAQLKVLEGNLDCKLFLKSGKNFVLSSDGQRLFAYCRRMFEIAEELETSFHSKMLQNQRVHIGVSKEIERPFVVEIISGIGEKGSKMPASITMTSDVHAQLILQLKTNSIDAAITHQPDFDTDIAIVSSMKMPVVLVYKQCNEFGSLSTAKEPELLSILRSLQVDWVLPHQTLKLRSEIDLFKEKYSLGGRVVFESDLLASVVRATLDGLGVALLPLPYVQTFVAQKKLKIQGPKPGFWNHEVWLLENKRNSNPMVPKLKSSFEKTGGSQIISNHLRAKSTE